MDRDKQIGLGLISNLGSTVQLYKLIGLSGVYHLYVRTILLYKAAEGQSKLKREVLLFRDSTHSASIVAAMTGIDNQGKVILTYCAGNHGSAQQKHTYYISDIFHYSLFTSTSTPAPSQSAPIGGFFFVILRQTDET